MDASFLVAFHNRRDVHHAAAARVMERLVEGAWGAALLPEYVFLEVVTVLAARRDLATAVTVGDTLLAAREVELVPCSGLFADTFAVFRSQQLGLSFADCSILVTASRHGAKTVATFDRAFLGVDGITVVEA